MRKYFYRKLREYLDLYIRPEDRLFEIDVKGTAERLKFENHRVHVAPGVTEERKNFCELDEFRPDYVLLNGNIHYETDIQNFLETLGKSLTPSTRVIITYYSNLWRPLLRLATALGFGVRRPKKTGSLRRTCSNLLLLAGYELVREESKLLVPVYIPLLSYLANRFLAPLPGFSAF